MLYVPRDNNIHLVTLLWHSYYMLWNYVFLWYICYNFICLVFHLLQYNINNNVWPGNI
jgi:hypothetical protein